MYAIDSDLCVFVRGLVCFLQMDASEVGSSHGETRIDHLWRKKLENALKDTVRPPTLKEALRDLAIFSEIDMEDLMVVVDGKSNEWKNFLYSPTSGFNLPKSYPLDFAVAIYAVLHA